MNTTLNTRALAFAGTAAGALLTVVCFAIYAILGRPDPWMDLIIGSGPSLGGWVVGSVEMGIVFGLVAAVIGALYNRLARTASPSQ